MKKIPIPFWEYARWIAFLNNNEPHRVDDFAQSFAENQVYAKSWLVERLVMHRIADKPDKKVWVLGSWYGTILVPLLIAKIPKIKEIHLVDMDEGALEISSSIFRQYPIHTHHLDINFDLTQLKADLIINTSCEHMLPMNEFDFKGTCAFQSNNFKEEAAHINCVNSLEEFHLQSGIQRADYLDEINFHRYDDHHRRYMIIGDR